MQYPTNPTVRAELARIRSERKLTNAALGKLLGVSATFIAKYINDNLDHNPKDFDAVAADTIRAIENRLDLASALFETSVSKAIAGRVDIARRTGHSCLFGSPAGEGKTSGGIIQVSRWDLINRAVNEFLGPQEQINRVSNGKVIAEPVMRLCQKVQGSPAIVETLEAHLVTGSDKDENGDFVDECENHLLLADGYSALAEMMGAALRITGIITDASKIRIGGGSITRPIFTPSRLG